MNINLELKDKQLQELLKKSKQDVLSPDFTKVVMQNIEAYEAKKANSVDYIKRAWILIVLAIVISPFALLYISNLTCKHAYYLAKIVPDICQVIQYLFLIIFTSVILYQLNILISFKHKEQAIKVS